MERDEEAIKRQESIDLLNSTHTFPQPVIIKVIGKHTGEFRERVSSAVQQQLGLAQPPEMKTRETAGGRHVAITVEPTFESAEQVLELYEALRQIPEAVMLL